MPKSQDTARTLYLVDVSSFIFRAFYAIRSLSTRSGEPTNAVYGVATMLTRLVQDAQAEYLAIVYDSKEPSVRKKIYADYKANRSAPPDDLIPQFARIEQLITAMRMPSFRQSGIEADDLIATLTKEWCKQDPKHQVVVVTGDKDLMQLVDKRVKVWDTLANKTYEASDVEEKFGVKPSQLRDYLALVGDSSDNIPGVPSIGPKSASELLKTYGDLKGVLKAAADGKIAGKKGEVLKTHKNDALLSQELATLNDSLKVLAGPEQLTYKHEITDELVALLHELDFKGLVQKWGVHRVESASGRLDSGAPGLGKDGAAGVGAHAVQTEFVMGGHSAGGVTNSTVPAKTASATFHTISTEKDLKALLARIEKKGEFGFDLETTSLNPRQAELVGVALAVDTETGYYIPVGHRGVDLVQLPEKKVLELLKPLLENPLIKKVGQNLKYDWSVLRQFGIEAEGLGADTMVAAYVLEPEGRHNLSTIAMMHLGYEVLTYEQVCGKGKDQIGFDQVSIADATRYSGEDAWVALKLWECLQPKLQKEGLMQIFAEIDLPLVPVLTKMECEGVCIDEKWLAQLSKEFERDLDRIQKTIEAEIKRPINLNSPKQLAQLLFEELKLPPVSKTKTGFSTDASVLAELASLHIIPKMILEFREVSKLKGTYVDPLPTLKDAKTGKIHATFSQTVAATGRLSSSDPNLQNIPIRTERGKKLRRAFIPSPGNVLISADYSQIELRLLAHMSGDKELVASFNRDEDVHRRTASEIFGINPEKVDDRQRGIAKAINFGLMYGKTAFGLSQELKIPRKEAQETIDRYFERYSGVKHFLNAQIVQAKETGAAVTLFGRKRNLPELHSSNPAVRNGAERMAMNAPIQGTAADMIKIAMVRLQDELERLGLKAKMIIQVHDELVLDCPVKEQKQVEALVVDVMENAMKLSVPLKVNSGHGESWFEI